MPSGMLLRVVMDPSRHPTCALLIAAPEASDACGACLLLLLLLVAQGIVPREAAVHIMMGRLHKRLRNPDAALTSFNIGKQ